MKITKEQMAERLNGREYGEEITREECQIAKASGLLVIFGYSDDNAEMRGVFDDEVGCYDGGKFRITEKCVLSEPSDEDREVLEKFNVLDAVLKCGAEVEAVWDKDGYSWTYKTAVPHATFEIVEDGEKYCRGIVIAVSDLANK